MRLVLEDSQNKLATTNQRSSSISNRLLFFQISHENTPPQRNRSSNGSLSGSLRTDLSPAAPKTRSAATLQPHLPTNRTCSANDPTRAPLSHLHRTRDPNATLTLSHPPTTPPLHATLHRYTKHGDNLMESNATREPYTYGPFSFRSETGGDVAHFCSSAIVRDPLFDLTTVLGGEPCARRMVEIWTTLDIDDLRAIAASHTHLQTIFLTLRPGRLKDVEVPL
jgi:hypothetical protein